MGDRPLRSPRHRRLGGPSPRQLATVTHAPPPPMNILPLRDAPAWSYAVLISLSEGYPPVAGRLHTRYSPVRRSSAGASSPVTPRLACVRPLASVHPEPGSNSPLYELFFLSFSQILRLYEPLVLTYISICPVLPRKLQMFSKISIFWRRTLSRAAYFLASVSASVSFLPESECKSIADFRTAQAF